MPSSIISFFLFFARQVDDASASPAAEPEPDSGSEFGTTLQLGSPSPLQELDTDDEEVPPLEDARVDTDDEEVPPLENASGEVAETMMDEEMDGEEVTDSEDDHEGPTYGIYGRQASLREPDSEPADSPIPVDESPVTPKGKSYGWREELFTTPQFGNSGPTRPEMVEMCIALMEFFKANYPDILKSLSFQRATYFCFSSPKAPKMFGNDTKIK